jgi:hypothetical protein
MPFDMARCAAATIFCFLRCRDARCQLGTIIAPHNYLNGSINSSALQSAVVSARIFTVLTECHLRPSHLDDYEKDCGTVTYDTHLVEQSYLARFFDIRKCHADALIEFTPENANLRNLVVGMAATLIMHLVTKTSTGHA